VDYPAALEQGWTIATGIIEGACRHFVEGSTDLTGARWRELRGAEAVLKLRALHCNGDFDTNWTWHLAQEQRRVHQSLPQQRRSPRRMRSLQKSRTLFGYPASTLANTIGAIRRQVSCCGPFVCCPEGFVVQMGLQSLCVQEKVMCPAPEQGGVRTEVMRRLV
jgi:hypothetical protein